MVANSMIINTHLGLGATGIDPIASGSDWKRLQAMAGSTAMASGSTLQAKRWEAMGSEKQRQSLPIASDSRLQSLPIASSRFQTEMAMDDRTCACFYVCVCTYTSARMTLKCMNTCSATEQVLRRCTHITSTVDMSAALSTTPHGPFPWLHTYLPL
jgi:hypothetical protein